MITSHKMGFISETKNSADLTSLINQERYGKTPLSHAFDSGDIELIKILLDKKAKLGSSLDDHYLIMRLIDESAPEELIDLAFEAGADIATIDTLNGRNALFDAVLKNNLTAAKWLIRENIDINHKDNHGFTVLHHAIANRRSFEWLELLLRSEADPSITTGVGDRGCNALTMMCRDYPAGDTRCRVVQMMLGDDTEDNIFALLGHTHVIHDTKCPGLPVSGEIPGVPSETDFVKCLSPFAEPEVLGIPRPRSPL